MNKSYKCLLIRLILTVNYGRLLIIHVLKRYTLKNFPSCCRRFPAAATIHFQHEVCPCLNLPVKLTPSWKRKDKIQASL
ncbi:hypothetical protein BDW71DRAFT_182795, partial [Aspergillus fruticulosus]